MMDYISHAISLTDALSVAGSSITNQELCLFILGGLGPEYENLVVSLTTKSECLTIKDVQGFLFNYEIQMSR